jgi:hypothetical protein
MNEMDEDARMFGIRNWWTEPCDRDDRVNGQRKINGG